MLCAISGEAPQVPVVSKKSGSVFEKRLIEAYIAENGTDPITKEELTADDLIEVQTTVVRPRPPTFTSIPSLLSVFQEEWDALAVETFALRQQLAQTKQELSLALYQNDAAVRAIAKLTRERDEARDALSKITVNGTSASNGDAMQVDGKGLSDAVITRITETQERLSKTRRKRPIPDDWASAEDISGLRPKAISGYSPKAVAHIALQGDTILVGQDNGTVEVYADGAVAQTFEVDDAITAVEWTDGRAVIATAKGTVQVIQQGGEALNFTRHSGAVTALAPHPSGALLASVGNDKSFVFYDLESEQAALQIHTNSPLTTAAFHPDGHLFATGGKDGLIKLFNVTDGSSAADLDTSEPIIDLSFSENGTWLACINQDQTSVQVWDLRKAAQIKLLEIGGPLSSVAFDYTGQFLLAAGSRGIAVQQYSKSSKEWEEILRAAVPAQHGVWGPQASNIFIVGTDGALSEVA